MQSDDSNSIPMLESKSPPIASGRRKRRSTKSVEVLKILVFIALIVLVLILIIALVMVLFRKCSSTQLPDKTAVVVPKPTRKNNSFWNKEELPNFANPNSYILVLQLLTEAQNLTEHELANNFFGYVAINLTMNNNSKFVVLNVEYLTIKTITIKNANFPNKGIGIIDQIVDKFYNQLIIVFNDTLKQNQPYFLEIVYSGNITTRESGIIRTFYRNLKLKKVYDILYSKLEPIGARRMFPCFDEPDKKALFVVKLIHFSKYTALSNMPLIHKTEINQNSLIVKDDIVPGNSSVTMSVFNSTFVYMSTYLVAFVLVEDFEVISQVRKANKTVAIWLPKGYQDHGTVSLQYSVTTENFLEEYLDFSSPMPKTDHIYIPNFLSGAMENWGLITYREDHLLMSPRQGEFLSKKAYMTIAHELAHIWFGNWVTMKTWRDLWLNEGFATYFASYAFFKQLKLSSMTDIDQLFLYYNRQVMDKDGKQPSYPVRLGTINYKNMFNGFTYSKGQALLTWLNSIMDEQKFRAGIQEYIKIYAEKCPTTEQFFDVMQIQGTKDSTFDGLLKVFFEPWLNTIGYPIITVNYDIAQKELILSQHSVVINATSNVTWPIYTVIKTEQNPMDAAIFFRNKVHRHGNLNLNDKEFVLVNGDGKSYVRVNYSNYLWTKIIDNIKSSNPNINIINKIVLFDDNLYFADNQLIDLKITKSLLDTLINETNIVPWSLFYGKIFSKIYELFNDEVIYLKWSSYVEKLSKKVLFEAQKIDMHPTLTFDDEIYQRQIYLMNCEIDNGVVLDLLSKKFEMYIGNPKVGTLPHHLASTILYYGMKINDKYSNWMKLWKILIGKDQSDSVNKDKIAVGLAGTSKAYLLNKLLEYTITPGTHASDIDKHNEFNNLMKWILQSYNGIHVLRRWILTHHKRIKKYAFGDNVGKEFGINYFEMLLAKIASTTYDLNMIRPLLTLHRNKMTLTKIVMNNNQWRESVGKRLLQHL